MALDQGARPTARNEMGMPMKRLMIGALAALAASSAALAAPGRLDLSNPVDALAASRKVQCSLKDGEPVVFHWSGKIYSRVPGEPDRHLFNLEGMNVRACVTVKDAVKGDGYKLISRELMLYLDPKTGEVLKTWNNPWTGKAVDVVHVANDPVNARVPTFPRNDKGEPFKFEGRTQGGRIFMPIEVPLFYKNPLAGDYQDYVGNQYHAMEIFDFMLDEKDLLDARKSTAQAAVAWVRIAEWLPWMEMNSRSGIMVINAMGQTVPGIDALPPVLQTQLAGDYKTYRTPPPLDDARPNDTSWTVFKRYIDAKRAAAAK